MDTGGLHAHDLRSPWWLSTAAVGCVAVALTSPLPVLVVASVLAGFAIPAFHLKDCRLLAARCASISAGLCVPAIPLSVLVLVDSL